VGGRKENKMARKVVLECTAPAVTREAATEALLMAITGGDLVGYYKRALEIQHAADAEEKQPMCP
jgi:hypothetical protein